MCIRDRVHVFSKSAVGDLKRPWKTSDGLATVWKRTVGGVAVNQQNPMALKHVERDDKKKE